MENLIQLNVFPNLVIRLYERHLSVVKAETHLALSDIFKRNVQVSWFLRFWQILFSRENSDADRLTKCVYLDSISLNSTAEI